MHTPNSAELTLLAILGNPELARAAFKVVKDGTQLFIQDRYRHLYFMWSEYLKWLKHCRTTDTKPYINLGSANLADKVAEAASDGRLTKIESDACSALLDKLNAKDFPTLEEGRAVLAAYTQESAVAGIGKALRDNPDLKKIAQQINRAHNAVNEVMIDTEAEQAVTVYNPFKQLQRLLRVHERIPTGINWLDDMSNGGGRVGEVWAILGPSGGGKTALAVQWACRQMVLGQPILWATYEQTMEGDISERMVACLTNTSLDKIRDKGYENLPAEVITKLEATIPDGDYVQTLDMTRMRPDDADPEDNMGVSRVHKELHKLKEQGVNIKVVLIDWFGAMMSRIATTTGQSLDSGYRHIGQAEIQKAIRMAKQEGVLVVFFHQTDMKTQHASPTYKPDMTCSKDMKDLCNYMDLVFTLGRRDTNSICWFNGAKTRKGQSKSMTLELHGEYARFEQVKGWLPGNKGEFYKSDEDPSQTGFSTPTTGYTRELE